VLTQGLVPVSHHSMEDSLPVTVKKGSKVLIAREKTSLAFLLMGEWDVLVLSCFVNGMVSARLAY